MARRLLFLAALALAGRAFGQGVSGELRGRVTSEGKPAAGVTITANAPALLRERSTLTAADGRYWLPALPPGEYDVTFANAGMQTLTRRVEIRLASLARLDADLEPSPEGEAVTRLEKRRSVLEATQIETTFETQSIAALPVDRTVAARVELASFPVRTAVLLHIRDGVVSRRDEEPVAEAIDQTTILSVPLSAEYGRFNGGVITTITRTGGTEPLASVRATLTSSQRDRSTRLESAGGTTIGDAVSIFLAGQSDPQRLSGKAQIAPASRHLLSGSILHRSHDDEAAIRYDGSLTPTLHVEGTLSDAESRYGALRGHAFLGGRHEIAAGVDDFANDSAVFVNDRLQAGTRWTVSLGARYDERLGTSPRLGAAFDVRGDGRQRIVATYARYASQEHGAERQLALAWARQLEANGFVRLGAVRQNGTSIECEAAYQFLFLRLGATASLGDDSRAAAWVDIEPPLLDHDLHVAILQRYRQEHAATDLAVSYGFARGRIEPFVKAEAIDVFTSGSRTFRFGIGAFFATIGD